MMHSLESLTFLPGSRYCLHVPLLYRPEMLRHDLAAATSIQSSQANIAEFPRHEFLYSTRDRPTLPVEWLAAKTNSSVADAKRVISSLPVRVPERFSEMAQNPMRFLAFVRAMHGDPKLLIYKTDGMDPKGRHLLHTYAAENFTHGILIHFTTTPATSCPLFTNCHSILGTKPDEKESPR